eukprot:s1005_g33.t1
MNINVASSLLHRRFHGRALWFEFLCFLHHCWESTETEPWSCADFLLFTMHCKPGQQNGVKSRDKIPNGSICSPGPMKRVVVRLWVSIFRVMELSWRTASLITMHTSAIARTLLSDFPFGMPMDVQLIQM